MLLLVSSYVMDPHISLVSGFDGHCVSVNFHITRILKVLDAFFGVYVKHDLHVYN